MFTINVTHKTALLSEIDTSSKVVLFDGKRNLMAEGGMRLPTASEVATAESKCMSMMYVGICDGNECWGASVSKDYVPPKGCEMIESRFAFTHANSDIPEIISRCRIFVKWSASHKYCGACGKPMKFADSDLAIVCPECGMMYYPQIAPAVITMVTRNNGREILLAHNKRFSSPTFSLIAGFVEGGESLEQAVAREIMEETGIEVKNIRYLHSQSWPFPNSLMLGFTAEYKSGVPFPRDGELSEIGWFTRDNLPQIPAPGSIARRIIDEYCSL